jgi:hypothetical protein
MTDPRPPRPGGHLWRYGPPPSPEQQREHAKAHPHPDSPMRGAWLAHPDSSGPHPWLLYGEPGVAPSGDRWWAPCTPDGRPAKWPALDARAAQADRGEPVAYAVMIGGRVLSLWHPSATLTLSECQGIAEQLAEAFADEAVALYR